MENEIQMNYLDLPNELRIRFIKSEIMTRNGRILKGRFLLVFICRTLHFIMAVTKLINSKKKQHAHTT